ncbi:MAG: OmpH/Skp family outer membrane protein [Planctomycetota bacterium]|jgi:Skp family chaperone for outer membrane proteins
MKIKAMILGCFIGVIVLSAGYEALKSPLAAFAGPANSPSVSEVDKGGLRIGVVDIRKVVEGSNRMAGYMKEILAEQQRLRVKWDAIAKEIESDKTGLNTLKPGSSDYLIQVKDMLQKQANLRTEQEYYKERMKFKELQITEGFFSDILREVGVLAKEKGLDLVFESSEPRLPASSITQLEFAMGTQKLLYHSGCVDITGEVMARVDTNISGQ